MSRIIKFRIWSPTDKAYRFLPMLTPRMTHMGDVGVLRVDGAETHTFWEYPDAALEQFTGLLDSKGREIYEGDIVKIESRDYLKEIYYTVCWTDSLFFFGIYKVAGFVLRGQEEQALIPMGTYPMEVIGNVHEHPELIRAL